MITLEDAWGGMPSCGRLSIGLARFVPKSKPITNRLQGYQAAPRSPGQYKSSSGEPHRCAHPANHRDQIG
jgi:hypothetical protein